jgi:NADPH-dependent glutamate synthase beta subunit-like oxidoreductase
MAAHILVVMAGVTAVKVAAAVLLHGALEVAAELAATQQTAGPEKAETTQETLTLQAARVEAALALLAMALVLRLMLQAAEVAA